MDAYGYAQAEIERHGHWTECRDGEMIYSDEEAVRSILANYDPLPDAKIDAKKRIVEQSESVMIGIEREYPSFERATWPTQKAEVEAWVADNSAPTPLLDVISSTREMDRITLLNRTYDKVNAYNVQAATLAGKRQKLEDDIDAATDLDFINSVNFEY